MSNDLSPMLGGQSELTGREPMLGGDKKKALITVLRLTEPCECEICNRLHDDMVISVAAAYGFPPHIFNGDTNEAYRRLHR